MDDRVRNNEAEQQFEIDLGDSKAVATYKLVPGKIIFPHTVVPREHEGQGIGSALIRAGLTYAREHHLQVVPLCPFFAAYMKKHDEVQDLLDSESRRKLGLEQG
jgi:predicted GNAT family acetyltransferase